MSRWYETPHSINPHTPMKGKERSDWNLFFWGSFRIQVQKPRSASPLINQFPAFGISIINQLRILLSINSTSFWEFFLLTVLYPGVILFWSVFLCLFLTFNLETDNFLWVKRRCFHIFQRNRLRNLSSSLVREFSMHWNINFRSSAKNRAVECNTSFGNSLIKIENTKVPRIEP